jgi:tripartite ATP-independent transporter DctM subunit
MRTTGGRDAMPMDTADPHLPPAPDAPVTGWRRWLRGAENLFVIVPLALAVALPLIEVVLRRFHAGLGASILLVQNATLIIGMAGAAIAARENRLLTFSTLSGFLHGRVKAAARIVSNGAAAAICGLLALAGALFVMAERKAGEILAYGIPVWAVELVLPVGFGLIAARLIRHAAEGWRGRAAALLLALAAGGFGVACGGVWQWVDPARLVLPGLVCLLLVTILGAPVFTAIGGAALLLFWGEQLPIATIPLKHHSLVTSQSLPTIPLFTLAGYLLAESGASRRLIHVFQAWCGAMRGGPAIVTVLVCAFFTAFTGASGVTILALGGLLLPVLHAAGYRERDALGLLTGAGSLGLLFPPCLPVILYSIIAGTVIANMGLGGSGTSVTMEKMFLGGLIPGVLMMALAGLWGVWRQPRAAVRVAKFDLREAVRAMADAKWELLLPVVALAALFGGLATPVEAAAITAAFAFLITTVVRRDLHPLRDVPRVMTECGLLVGGVLLILGVALGFTHYLVQAQIPDQLVEWSSHAVRSKWVFLLGLNVILIFVGGLIEIYAAIVVVVPLLVPVGMNMGIDPIHLGIVFLANMELGFIAPPVGLNLLLASYRFNKPILEVARASLPMLLILFIGVLLITYVPCLTTCLPGLVK